MRVIGVLIAKDLRLLLADKVGFFFVFFWPLLFALFFGFVTSGMYRTGQGERKVTVGVVDEDGSDASKAFVGRLAQREALRVRAYNAVDGAAGAVRGRDLAAYVRIPAGYAEQRRGIFQGQSVELDVVVDPSRGMETALIRGLVQATAYEQLQRLFTSPDEMVSIVRESRETLRDADELSAAQRMLLNMYLGATEQFFSQFDFDREATTAAGATQPARAAFRPIVVTTRQIGAAVERAAPEGDNAGAHPMTGATVWSVVFPQGILWGIMACAATFAYSLVMERVRGSLPRLATAPIHHWHILAGKGGACFIAAVFVAVVLLAIAQFGFGVVPRSYALLALAIACTAVSVVGIMMLFAVVGRTEAAVSGISWGVIVVMAMLGGGMVPLALLAGWMETLSYFSVFRWAILALEGAIWRGFTIDQMLVPCGVLLAIGGAGFSAGAAFFRWRM